MLHISQVLVFSVFAIHVYILILEMFLWMKPLGMKVFRMTPEKAELTRVLAANQGLYNGFLAAGLLWSLFYPNDLVAEDIAIFFLLCVAIAGIYGSQTVSRRILYVQSIPATLGLFSILLFGLR